MMIVSTLPAHSQAKKFSGKSSLYENKEVGFHIRIPAEFKLRVPGEPNKSYEDVSWAGPTVNGVATTVAVTRNSLGNDPAAAADKELAFFQKQKDCKDVKALTLPDGSKGVTWFCPDPFEAKKFLRNVRWYLPGKPYTYLIQTGSFQSDQKSELQELFQAVIESFAPVGQPKRELKILK